ncbi:MAG: sodium/glutamate symporter [Deferribacterota bacterium]|nr:sodium/glutamate symporter [Deferribacterota bacterium]
MKTIEWLGNVFISDNLNTFFAYLCLLSIFLIIGKVLRVRVKILQDFFIPASIIGGFVGLICGPFILGAVYPGKNDVFLNLLSNIRIGFSSFPGRFIDVVFAAMFIGITLPSIKKMWNLGGRQFAYGTMVGGPMQHFIGGLLVIFLLGPLFGVDPTFATFAAIGFCGGHGTAGGMAPSFREGYPGLNWSFPEGADLLMTSATVGVLIASIVGIILINIGAKKGYCKRLKEPKELPEEVRVGVIPYDKKYTIAEATVSPESIEPFAFHVALVFIAVAIGYIIDDLLALLGIFLSNITGKTLVATAFDAVPTFPLAMIGGVILQFFLKSFGIVDIIDRNTIERIQGVALDFLVVSAIASISIPVVIAYFVPFFILLLAVASYIVFATWFIAPRMLTGSWFEKAMVEFGMQTGVTAMGLCLLRIVDPGFKTEALEAFGIKQLAYEPFFGGGFVTALSPLLILTAGPYWFCLIMLSITLFFVVVGIFSGWFHKKDTGVA